MTNLPFIENINRFTYEIRELPSKEKTTERTKTNIYEKTKAFLKKQRKRSNADMNNFYYVAAHILKIAPSLYDKML